MQESGEMYLETILLLQNRQANIRSIDIANQLGFSRASVSRGVTILKNAGYITIDQKGLINLTDTGFNKANAIYEKHLYLTDFLMMTAQVSKKVAEEDACRIEHIISEDVFLGIKKFVANNKK